MPLNINVMNQNNNYSLGKPNVSTVFSALQMASTMTSTGNLNDLIPVDTMELQPNQTVKTQIGINMQFAPLTNTLMHQVKGELVTYFVPNRLIWDKWEEFITGGEDGLSTEPHLNKSLGNLLYQATTKENFKEAAAKDATLEEAFRNFDRNAHGANTNPQKKAAIHAIGELIQRYNEITNGNSYAYTQKVIDETNPFLKMNTWHKVLEDLLTGEDSQFVTPFIRKYFQNTQKALTHTIWDYNKLPTSLVLIIAFVFKERRNESLMNLEFGTYCQKLLDKKVSVLPFRAYYKIYNDWIRLIDWENNINIDETPFNIEQGNADWDYFSRARRYQIRGAMPTIPITGQPLFKDEGSNATSQGLKNNFALDDNIQRSSVSLTFTDEDGTQSALIEFQNVMTAAALMNYYTANARIKPRYAEHLLARWNVRIQDARLQLTEIVARNNISITSQGVIQTAPATSEEGTKQGNITGQLWGQSAGHIGYQAQEHGLLITLLQIKPANAYEMGIPALFKKDNKFDYPTPEMANLPDRPILEEELNILKDVEAIIGYKTIYDEYRTRVNTVTGLVRPSTGTAYGFSQYTLAKSFGDVTIKDIVKNQRSLKKVKQYVNQPDFILITGLQTETAIPLPYTSDPTKIL